MLRRLVKFTAVLIAIFAVLAGVVLAAHARPDSAIGQSILHFMAGSPPLVPVMAPGPGMGSSGGCGGMKESSSCSGGAEEPAAPGGEDAAEAAAEKEAAESEEASQ